MRVLIVDTCYPAFLRSHYGRDHGLAEAPYERQWRSLMDTFFGTADAYSHYLGELGHPAHELVVNCEPLQRAWAAERGLRRGPWRRRPTLHQIALAQAEEFEPDVVYVQDLRALPAPVLRRLREQAGFLAGQIASELPPAEQLACFDLILTSFPHYPAQLARHGVEAAFLRIGFDPRVLARLGPDLPRSDAVFAGALYRGRQHARGNELLERAAGRVELDFWGPGADSWPEDSPVRRRHRGEAWGLEMYRVLAGARIAVNRHIDVAEDAANNMRLYEATGVGTLLLTDAKRNLAELFEPGHEVVAYANENDLVDKLRHFLAHEDERAAIARAGQARTLREHTYAHRMRELSELLAARAG